jgi:hypothetical protein
MKTALQGFLLSAFLILATAVAVATEVQPQPDPEGSAAVSSSDGVIAYANGGYYKGEMHDGKREGEGVYLYPDYGIYTGQWKDGKKDGLGTYQWPNGNIYQGEWLNGVMHGGGTLVFADGGIFEGHWVNGEAQDDTAPPQAATTEAERQARIREQFCELKDTIAEAHQAFAAYFANEAASGPGGEAGQAVTRGIEDRCR